MKNRIRGKWTAALFGKAENASELPEEFFAEGVAMRDGRVVSLDEFMAEVQAGSTAQGRLRSLSPFRRR